MNSRKEGERREERGDYSYITMGEKGDRRRGD